MISRWYPEVRSTEGQEYDRVCIDPDIAASLSRPETILTGAFGDEANIAYLSACLPVPLGRQTGIAQAGVGFTRAIRELHLPRDFKTILTPEWQETVKQYEPVQVSRTSKASLTPQKRAPRSALPGTRSGEFTIEADSPKPPREKLFKVGDRARPGATNPILHPGIGLII